MTLSEKRTREDLIFACIHGHKWLSTRFTDSFHPQSPDCPICGNGWAYVAGDGDYNNPPCSGGCGKVRSVVTSEDAGKQWLCNECWTNRLSVYDNPVTVRKHFIAMSGLHGCLPDYCEVFPTYQDAVDALADMFSLGRTRKARLFADRTLELNNGRDGAEYCEITECTCDNPGQHSDNGVDLDEYIIRDEQTEVK